MTPSQQLRDDVQAERAAFVGVQASLDAERVLFVDESGIERGMRCRYGYAPKRERCREHAPFRVGARTSVLGWVGLRGGHFAPLTGTVDGGVFARFVEHGLVPHLRPGDVVIWDNARIHGADAVRLVEATGARVVAQPRYSPDKNAIEPAWSKVKERVRRLRADTSDALDAALRAAVATLTSDDVRGWMRHCGYPTAPA